MIVRRKSADPQLPENGHLWDRLDPVAAYRVIGIKDTYYRLQTCPDGWPCAYPAALFDIVNSKVEPDWIVSSFEDSVSIEFQECAHRGFWEDIHDGSVEAIRVLIPILDRLGIRHP